MTSFTTTMHSQAPLAVPSLAQSGTAFLRVVPERDDRVRVGRTAAGKKRLNPFWAVWLRQLILQNTAVDSGFAVELRDNDVLISAPTADTGAGAAMTPHGLLMSVMHIAGQIVPIPGPPMYRHWEQKFEMTWWPESNRRRHWEPFADFEALAHRLTRLELPPHVRLQPDLYDIRLVRAKRCQFRMRHLAHMVELNVALHYGTSYQLFPTP